MRLLKTHPILGLLNSYMVDSPQPANLSYMWNFGSLLGLCLGIQIVTGVTLAMHYTPSVDLAFISVEHIMRDVNYGWLIRYLHANVASFFLYLCIPTYWARVILRIIQITTNTTMINWSYHVGSNDGNCVLGLRLTIRTNVIMRFIIEPHMRLSSWCTRYVLWLSILTTTSPLLPYFYLTVS